MTDQNIAAQAAGKILTYLGFAQAMSMEPGVDRRRDHIQSLIESTLLSQLRAEGVQAGEPVADERCKRCGGPGWYTSHTAGYPESIPCSACNPQGVSVEQLENDPFLAAQLWRKSADAEGSPLERILEHVSEYGESMVSSTLLSVRSIARRNVETRIAAELAALASAPVADERAAPIKRYYHGTDRMQETASGDWVRYDDYVAALASAPVAGEAKPGDYVQSVPDHCDRIVWRGRYYALGRTAILAGDAYGHKPVPVDASSGHSASVAGEAQPVAWRALWTLPTPGVTAWHDTRKVAPPDEAEMRAKGYSLELAFAATQASAEPLARYCPGCGSVGPVGDEYRDCCPDGNQARMIPARLAEKCRDTFRLAIQTLLADAAANDSATPQATEAVRILFPTHLRKMWSGGEVQAWLDNHQGITPPTPNAKGSLERYRDWKAEPAEVNKDQTK
ncbi:hypothetical protein ELS24_08975 [Achromobacter spanius]|uniref:hypothetical protein n=1 Tax=Achromobacter spanius TaxID=217203 RepID=UPI000F8FB840|nr:hypothetical protein [Achromobacter spanius]AZS78561.1 hypothetical protein ELS24_08975 [Achromobacter spanius]